MTRKQAANFLSGAIENALHAGFSLDSLTHYTKMVAAPQKQTVTRMVQGICSLNHCAINRLKPFETKQTEKDKELGL